MPSTPDVNGTNAEDLQNSPPTIRLNVSADLEDIPAYVPSEREMRIRNLCEQEFPGLSEQNFLADLQQKVGGTLETISGAHSESYSKFARDRDWLVGVLRDSDVPDEQMKEHVSELLEVEEVLRGPKLHYDVIAQKSSITPRAEQVDLSLLAQVARASPLEADAHLWKKLIPTWKNRLCDGIEDPREIERRMRQLMLMMQGLGELLKRKDQVTASPELLCESVMDVYEVAVSLPPSEKKLCDLLTNAAMKTADYKRSPGQVRALLTFLETVRSRSTDTDFITQYMDVVSKYGYYEMFTEDSIRGLSQKLLEAMLQKQPQVEPLQTAGNRWRMKKGSNGLNDYLCHCYALRVTPENLNDLLLSQREIPTSNFSRFESNRLDALTLAGTFGILRDFIHDQRPFVHEVLDEMVRYYESGDDTGLDAVLSKTDYLSNADTKKVIMDRSRYDNEVRDRSTENKETIRVIDVLRRLVTNTEPIPNKPPSTSYEDLNAQLATFRQKIEDGVVTEEALGTVVQNINTLLMKEMKDGAIGMEPTLVEAIAWIEHQCFELLKKMSFERSYGAYKKPWFRAVLRFQELTSSPGAYDSDQFEKFLTALDQAGSSEAAWRQISGRVIDQVEVLSRKYSAEGKTNRNGALWSGNIAHELMVPPVMRKAETPTGEKYRQEQTYPVWMRNTGE